MKAMNRRSAIGAVFAGVTATFASLRDGVSSAPLVCPDGTKRKGRECVPFTPTPTQTSTPQPTSTPFPTNTAVPTATSDPNATATPTASATSSPSPTSTPSGSWTELGVVSRATAATTVWGKTVSNLVFWNGFLFTGYGDYGANTPNPCELIAWDLGTDSFVNYGSVNTVALLDFHPLPDGSLAIPYDDLAVGTYPSVSFLHANGTHEILGSGFTPRPIHVYGAAIFNGQRYISGSQYVPHNTGEDTSAVWCEAPINQFDEQSTDTRISWNRMIPHTDASGPHTDWVANSWTGPTDTTTHTLDRAYGLWAQNGKLFASMSGQTGSVIKGTTDGKNWATVTSGPARCKKPIVVGSVSYHGSNEPGSQLGSVARFSGTTRTVIVSSGVRDHTVGDDGRLYILMSDGRILNESLQTVETSPTNAWSIARVGGKWYVGTSDSKLFVK